MKRFVGKLDAIGPGGSWTRMEIPFDASEAFGSKARIAVHGTINGFEFRSSILPNGDGTHHLMLNKPLLAGAKAVAGDSVKVSMEKDEASREVAAPKDLLASLERNAKANARWQAQTPTYRKEYILWIEGAKQEATRARRIETTLKKVAEGKRLS